MSWSDYGTERSNNRQGYLVGLNGFARSGKDTFGQFLIQNHNFKRLSFADALREGLYNINPIVTLEYTQSRQGFWEWISGEPSRIHTYIDRVQDIIDDIGWDEAKVEYPEIRNLMQKYGTEGGRNVHGEDCWTNILKKTILNNPNQNYVITDMRFENEIQLVKDLNGVAVKIKRDGVNSVNSHVSDKELDDSLFHHVVTNNGSLEELENKSENLIAVMGIVRDFPEARTASLDTAP